MFPCQRNWIGFQVYSLKWENLLLWLLVNLSGHYHDDYGYCHIVIMDSRKLKKCSLGYLPMANTHIRFQQFINWFSAWHVHVNTQILNLSVCFYFVYIVIRNNCSDIQLFLILVMTIVVLDLCIGNSVLFVKLNFPYSIPSCLRPGYFCNG